MLVWQKKSDFLDLLLDKSQKKDTISNRTTALFTQLEKIQEIEIYLSQSENILQEKTKILKEELEICPLCGRTD